jgi:hypothetical protein
MVLQATEMLRRFGWTPGHDALELAELCARLVCLNDASVQTELLKCVQATDSTSHHRRRAAERMLLAATFTLDKAAGDAAFAILEKEFTCGEPCDPAFELTSRLLYHVYFGDLDWVEASVPQLLSIADSKPPQESCDIRRRAGILWWQVGRTAEAVAAWIAAYEDATTACRLRCQYDVAFILATNLADADDAVLADKWWGIANEIADVIPSVAMMILALYHRIDIAAARQDLKELLACQSEMGSLLRRVPNCPARRFSAALDVLVRVLDDQAFEPEAVVAHLTGGHGIETELANPADFEVAVAVRACLAGGAIDLARSVQRRYVNVSRRVRSPVIISLREVTKELECAEGPVEA